MLNKSVFRIIFILSLSAAAYGEGACNEADQNHSIKRDSPEFVKNWEDCGRSSLAMTAVFNPCLQKRHETISQPCINCFGQFVGCTRTNCFFSCIGFSQQWCEKCALDNCQPSLIECTGVSKENLPSKYPKTPIARN